MSTSLSLLQQLPVICFLSSLNKLRNLICYFATGEGPGGGGGGGGGESHFLNDAMSSNCTFVLKQLIF